jgi:hypothetical protein
MVADLEGWIVVDERRLEFVDSDSIDSTLFAVELDPVQVDHRGEYGKLHITLSEGNRE